MSAEGRGHPPDKPRTSPGQAPDNRRDSQVKFETAGVEGDGSKKGLTDLYVYFFFSAGGCKCDRVFAGGVRERFNDKVGAARNACDLRLPGHFKILCTVGRGGEQFRVDVAIDTDEDADAAAICWQRNVFLAYGHAARRRGFPLRYFAFDDASPARHASIFWFDRSIRELCRLRGTLNLDHNGLKERLFNFLLRRRFRVVNLLFDFCYRGQNIGSRSRFILHL